MKYYITGGLGVIGSCFAEEMLKQGHHVTILDSAEEYRNIWMAKYLQDNYRKVVIHKAKMELFHFDDLRGHDFILHTAAHTGIPHSAIDPVDDWMSNVESTRNILEKLRKLDIKIPMVVLSSVKPYKVDDIPVSINSSRTSYMWSDDRVSHIWNGINEKNVMEPDEPYAASKMAQSALCMAYARTYGLPVMVFRCSNLYGPAPSHGPRHGWLTWFCLSAVLEREIEIQGNGFQVRDMLFSDDVSSAVLTAFEHINQTKGNVYNIGGGFQNSISVLEAVNLIEKIYKPIKRKQGTGRKHEDLIFITDYSKFNNATGWKPQINVETGITKIIKWAETNKDIVKKIYDGV
jgi:CDP-paratose 2-epimerase